VSDSVLAEHHVDQFPPMHMGTLQESVDHFLCFFFVCGDTVHNVGG